MHNVVGKNRIRDDSIDIIKAMGIFLVVYAHIILNQDYFERFEHHMAFIYSFHMPLFLVISGYCKGFNNHKVLDFMTEAKKVFLRLFLPYVLWSIIYIFLGGKVEEKLDEQICAVLTGKGLAPLWFLISLAVCELVFLVIRTSCKNVKLRYGILIGLAILTMWVSSDMVEDKVMLFEAQELPEDMWFQYYYIAIGRTLMCFGFFVVGYITYGLRLLERIPIVVQAILSVGFAFVVYDIVLNEKQATNMIWLVWEPTFVYTAILGSFSLIFFGKVVSYLFDLGKKYKVVTAIKQGITIYGRETLLIMILHYPPFRTMMYMTRVVWRIHVPIQLQLILATIFSMTVCLAMRQVLLWLLRHT